MQDAIGQRLERQYPSTPRIVPILLKYTNEINFIHGEVGFALLCRLSPCACTGSGNEKPTDRQGADYICFLLFVKACSSCNYLKVQLLCYCKLMQSSLFSVRGLYISPHTEQTQTMSILTVMRPVICIKINMLWIDFSYPVRAARLWKK